MTWAWELMAEIEPFTMDGVAVNFLSEVGDEQVKATCGKNYDRLVKLKNKWVPERLFQMNQNVQPSA